MLLKRALLATGLCAAVLVCGCTSAPQDTVSTATIVNDARQLDLDGKHGEAVARYREALEQSPDSFDAHYGIARALDLTGEYEEAQRHFATAVDLAPEGAKDQALRMMGLSHTFTRDVDGAAGAFRQVFDRRVAAGNFAGAAEVANELGRVYLELGDPDSAFRWYRTGYDTSARSSDGSAAQRDLAEFRWAHAQARIESRRGNATAARQHESAAEEIVAQGHIPDQQIQLPYLRGYVAFYLGDYDDAIAALREADQEDPFILILIGQALERSGRAQEAGAYYQKALASSSHAVANAIARPLARERLEQAGGT